MTYKTKPGFVRVFIPSRNKYTRIRSQHANNPNYLQRNGMVVVAEPVAPPVMVTTSPLDTIITNEFEKSIMQNGVGNSKQTVQNRYPSTPTIQADDVVAVEAPATVATTPAKSKRSKPKSTK